MKATLRHSASAVIGFKSEKPMVEGSNLTKVQYDDQNQQKQKKGQNSNLTNKTKQIKHT